MFSYLVSGGPASVMRHLKRLSSGVARGVARPCEKDEGGAGEPGGGESVSEEQVGPGQGGEQWRAVVMATLWCALLLYPFVVSRTHAQAFFLSCLQFMCATYREALR